jgi:hypothetical protein
VTDHHRDPYDVSRIWVRNHLDGGWITQFWKHLHAGRRLALLNRHAVSARRGLILSGPAGTGKTTAITQLGKTPRTIDKARHSCLDDRIPVVYVTVPPAATPRMLAVEFARFLGLPGEHHRCHRSCLRCHERHPDQLHQDAVDGDGAQPAVAHPGGPGPAIIRWDGAGVGSCTPQQGSRG